MPPLPQPPPPRSFQRQNDQISVRHRRFSFFRFVRIRFSMTPSAKTTRDVICRWLRPFVHHGCALDDRGICVIDYHYSSSDDNENNSSHSEPKKVMIVIEVPSEIVSGTFFLYTVICRDIGQYGRDAESLVMRTSLELNYLQQETRGACLSLDGNELTLCFCHMVSNCNKAMFGQLLDNFAETALQLRMQIEGRITSPPTFSLASSLMAPGRQQLQEEEGKEEIKEDNDELELQTTTTTASEVTTEQAEITEELLPGAVEIIDADDDSGDGFVVAPQPGRYQSVGLPSSNIRRVFDEAATVASIRGQKPPPHHHVHRPSPSFLTAKSKDDKNKNNNINDDHSSDKETRDDCDGTDSSQRQEQHNDEEGNLDGQRCIGDTVTPPPPPQTLSRRHTVSGRVVDPKDKPQEYQGRRYSDSIVENNNTAPPRRSISRHLSTHQLPIPEDFGDNLVPSLVYDSGSRRMLIDPGNSPLVRQRKQQEPLTTRTNNPGSMATVDTNIHNKKDLASALAAIDNKTESVVTLATTNKRKEDPPATLANELNPVATSATNNHDKPDPPGTLAANINNEEDSAATSATTINNMIGHMMDTVATLATNTQNRVEHQGRCHSDSIMNTITATGARPSLVYDSGSRRMLIDLGNSPLVRQHKQHSKSS